MEIRRLTNDKQDLSTFVKFPASLYETNKQYVPPIVNLEVERLLNEKSLERRNQFAYYMVFDNQKPLARVAAGMYKNLNQKSKHERGFLCYFDAVNNMEAARMLLDAATEDLKQRGANEILLMNSTKFSQFGKGVLVDGDSLTDAAIFPYHFAYYKDLLESYGFAAYNKHDTYLVQAKDFPYERFMLLSEKAMQRFHYHIESYVLNPSNIDSLTDKVVSVIHQCYSSDWEIPQPSVYDVRTDMEEAMRFSNANHLVFAYSDERIVGVLFIYANYHQRMQNYKGSLFPQYYLDRIVNSNTSKHYIAGMVFVVPDFQRKAVDLSMVCKAFTLAQNSGIETLEVFTIPTVTAQYERAFTSIGGLKTKEYAQFILKCAPDTVV